MHDSPQDLHSISHSSNRICAARSVQLRCCVKTQTKASMVAYALLLSNPMNMAAARLRLRLFAHVNGVLSREGRAVCKRGGWITEHVHSD